MEETIHHNTHRHPLKLMVVEGGDDENKKTTSICGFGEEPMSDGSSAYGCITCDYLIHKVCAQLGVTTIHHFHPQHPLYLFHLDHMGFTCDVCDGYTRATYICFQCPWRVCAKCVAAVVVHKDEIGVSIAHEGHPQHTLSLRLKPASFLCDACNTVTKDVSYQCNNCHFWIHRTCASLARGFHLPRHHQHPLLLSYQLPTRFHGYRYKCEFCDKVIKYISWVYHCPRCRYFTHIQCALNARSHGRAGTSSSPGAHANGYDDLVHFPMLEALTEPLKLLRDVKKDVSDDNDAIAVKKEINDHWSHPHHLLLVDSSSNVELHTDPIIVCNGCVRPLSLPYYHCNDDGCQFFLHKYCAELPHTLRKHPLHLIHDSLDLVDFHQFQTSNNAYICNACFLRGNSFLYQCKTCEFKLDVNCAFLPNIIKHEYHNHPLHLNFYDPLQTLFCKACDFFIEETTYSCNDCSFQLHYRCALRAPHTAAHRYCKGGHLVPLRYPPIDHLADFYCDICEEWIHPKNWMYHCDKCDNSFHIKCLVRKDFYGNCNFQGTIEVPYHKHPLTYARRRKTPRYVCYSCNQDINGHLILECGTRTCPFIICKTCHEIKLDPTDELIFWEVY